MSKPGNVWRKVHGKITKRPTNFSWLIDDKLAGSVMPTSFDELDWILKQGVKSIVTMTENALPQEWVNEIGYLHVPTPDLTAPDMERIDLAVDFIFQGIAQSLVLVFILFFLKKLLVVRVKLAYERIVRVCNASF